MRLLIVVAAISAAMASTSLALATPTLSSHDRQVIQGLSSRAKSIDLTGQRLAPSVTRSTQAMLNTCTTSQRRSPVANTVMYEVVVLNLSYKMRMQIHSINTYIRTQRFDNPLLVSWLRSVQKGVMLGEQSGVLSHPVNVAKFRSVLAKVSQLYNAKRIDEAGIADKVDEIVGLNIRQTKVSAATLGERQKMVGSILPMFQSAGLSADDVTRLASL